MQFKALKRKGAEQIFMVFKNGENFYLDGGTPVCLDYADSADGVTVKLPTTEMLHAFVGCVKDGEVLGTSGLPNEYGLVQVYGHHPGVYMAGSTVTPGAMLVPVNGVSYLTLAITHSDSTVETPNESIAFVIAGQTACLKASSTFGNKYKAFIRAL